MEGAKQFDEGPLRVRHSVLSFGGKPIVQTPTDGTKGGLQVTTRESLKDPGLVSREGKPSSRLPEGCSSGDKTDCSLSDYLFV